MPAAWLAHLHTCTHVYCNAKIIDLFCWPYHTDLHFLTPTNQLGGFCFCQLKFLQFSLRALRRFVLILNALHIEPHIRN